VEFALCPGLQFPRGYPKRRCVLNHHQWVSDVPVWIKRVEEAEPTSSLIVFSNVLEGGECMYLVRCTFHHLVVHQVDSRQCSQWTYRVGTSFSLAPRLTSKLNSPAYFMTPTYFFMLAQYRRLCLQYARTPRIHTPRVSQFVNRWERLRKSHC
jgi:hypothetical protein